MKHKIEEEPEYTDPDVVEPDVIQDVHTEEAEEDPGVTIGVERYGAS